MFVSFPACPNCGEFKHVDHRCFIQPVAKQNKTGNADPDFEAPLDDDSDEEDKKAPRLHRFQFLPILNVIKMKTGCFMQIWSAGLAPKRTKFLTPARLKIFWQLLKN